jgi:hypothetical protein
VAALIISIIALVLSGVSLGWQVWSWRRSGAVVAVTALHSFPVYDSTMASVTPTSTSPRAILVERRCR